MKKYLLAGGILLVFGTGAAAADTGVPSAGKISIENLSNLCLQAEKENKKKKEAGDLPNFHENNTEIHNFQTGATDTDGRFGFSPNSDIRAATYCIAQKTDNNTIETQVHTKEHSLLQHNNNGSLGNKVRFLVKIDDKYIAARINFIKKHKNGTGNADSNNPSKPGPSRYQVNENFCRRSHGSTDAYRFCFDDLNGTLSVAAGSAANMILPNRPIEVWVRHWPGADVDVSISNPRGLFTPGLQTHTTPANGRATGSGVVREGYATVKPVISRHIFAPRRPEKNGDGAIEVTVREQGKGDRKRALELEVMPTYAGAIRLGVATVFDGAQDASFDVESFPGSSTSEIVGNTAGAFDAELVVGYAPFFEHGGRSYMDPVTINPLSWRWAPYFGVGIGTEGENTFSLLKSLHAGVEVEPVQGFSIAATLVGRRVSRLKDGFAIGQAYAGSDAPFADGYSVGWGLVFNFSPEVLQLMGNPTVPGR